MTNKAAALKKEVEQLESEYTLAQSRPQPDRRMIDHLYKKLKKARKELADLETAEK